MEGGRTKMGRGGNGGRRSGRQNGAWRATSRHAHATWRSALLLSHLSRAMPRTRALPRIFCRTPAIRKRACYGGWKVSCPFYLFSRLLFFVHSSLPALPIPYCAACARLRLHARIAMHTCYPSVDIAGVSGGRAPLPAWGTENEWTVVGFILGSGTGTDRQFFIKCGQTK